MKKILALFLSLVLVFSLASGISAKAAISSKSEVKSITYNNEKIVDGDYVIHQQNGHVYIPVRDTFELLNYVVEWNGTYKVLFAEKYGNIYQLVPNSLNATYNDRDLLLTHEPIYINNKLYTTIDSFELVLPIDIEWNTQLKTLSIIDTADQGYFWKIENGENTVYLLGSIHVGDGSLYPMRDKIEREFYLSDNLVLEVDLTDEAALEKDEEKLMELMYLKEGELLKDYLSPETYSKVEELLYIVDDFQNLQPWVVQLILTNTIVSSNDYSGDLGIDIYYALKALEQDKDIDQLETMLIQYEALASFSLDYTIAQIEATLDIIYAEIESVETEVNDGGIGYLTELWKSGDDELLHQLINDMKKEEPEQYEKLLLNRHGRMLDEIEGYLNNNDDEIYFVIVGYLHTLGDDGLITLLKEKGYTVTKQ